MIRKKDNPWLRTTHTLYGKPKKIQRTSNTLKNYYRQTDPEQKKTIIQNKKNGILTYLELKMKKNGH